MTGRAVWSGEGTNGLGQWLCYGCSEILAITRIGKTTHIRSDLVALKHRREGLPTFGLPQRRLTTSKDAHSRSPRPDGFSSRRTVPAFVYCPRRGVCGRGQIVGVRPAMVR